MTYEYTTTSLIEAEIRATTPFSGSTIPTLTQVTTWIEEESNEINQLAGYNIGETSYSETIDYNGEELIALRHSPLISVNSVLYSTSDLGANYALTTTKVEGTDYSYYPETGELVILLSHWSPDSGRKRIQVNYTAGYSTTPMLIQKLATKKVAKRVLDTLVNYNLDQGNTGGSVSVGAISIVEPENLGLSTFKQLKTDMADLENKIVSGFGVYRYTQRY